MALFCFGMDCFGSSTNRAMTVSYFEMMVKFTFLVVVRPKRLVALTTSSVSPSGRLILAVNWPLSLGLILTSSPILIEESTLVVPVISKGEATIESGSGFWRVSSGGVRTALNWKPK